MSQLLARIQDLWASYNISEPMDYYFLDQNYDALVSEEKVLSRAILLFSILAVIISCLGLYGLSAFIAEQKTKEIGIRRVLGATATQVVMLLTKSFTTPVVISMAIAFPLAFIVLNQWLNNFAFKVTIGPWIFFGAGFMALVVALLTVSWQSLGAAFANPVDSLRNE